MRNLKNISEEVDKRNKKIEYQHQSYLASQKKLQIREKAWESKECQGLYKKLINVAGGFKIVRSGVRGKAKQMAITYYLNGKEPDYEEFKNSVNVANKIRFKHFHKNKLSRVTKE